MFSRSGYSDKTKQKWINYSTCSIYYVISEKATSACFYWVFFCYALLVSWRMACNSLALPVAYKCTYICRVWHIGYCERGHQFIYTGITHLIHYISYVLPACKTVILYKFAPLLFIVWLYTVNVSFVDVPHTGRHISHCVMGCEETPDQTAFS